MTAIGFHLSLRLVDSRVIAPTVADRRKLARAVLRVGRRHTLLAFRCVDTHLHLEQIGDRPAAGRLAREAALSLRWRLALPVAFAPAHIITIGDQRHLGNAFDYIFRQEEHHGAHLDPRFEASNLPDLLGLRTVGNYTRAHVQTFLPREDLERLARRRGLELGDRQSSAERLAEAAAAALAIPDITVGRSLRVVAARRAAVRAGPEIDTAELAQHLGVSPRTVRRLRAQRAQVAPELAHAIELQLRLCSNELPAPLDPRPRGQPAPLLLGDQGESHRQ